MAQSPPLRGIRVLEFAGLAPGPFAGMLLADYGASVLRVDRAVKNAPHMPARDLLTRHKSSIALDLKSEGGIDLIKALIPHVDVVIDPFRPGVLEKLGLSPQDVMLKLNPRVIVGRMTGFRRDGKYAQMAGHDINYLAVAGVLSMLGRHNEKPYAPGNILGDFAGGGAVCFTGILLALFKRSTTGQGQVVEANMVDGSAYMATMPRLATNSPVWGGPRGTNLLDGGCPYYDTYETKDGRYVAVGALEPQFYAALIKGLGLSPSSLPQEDRTNPASWPALVSLFTKTFKSKTRDEWAAIFDGTDACCVPVLSQSELREQGFKHRPLVTLRGSPGLATSKPAHGADEGIEGQGPGWDGEGWTAKGLQVGEGGEELVKEWTGWISGREYRVEDGVIRLVNNGSGARKAKL